MTAFFARIAPGLEDLLETELRALGAEHCRRRHGGVAWTGDCASAYRACLWSRLASRVLRVLDTFPVDGADALYAGAAAIDWTAHLPAGATFAVRASGQAEGLHHSAFAGLKVKDAVVDCLRAARGSRPDVDVRSPDLWIHLQLQGNRASLALDLGGGPLHRRGLEREAGAAPLKEHVAAAMLQRSAWDGRSPLVDPMCGAGTLLLEAAMLAQDWAPGLSRPRHGLTAWAQYDAGLWEPMLAEARARREAARARPGPVLIGFDSEPEAVRLARRNLERAGLSAYVQLHQGDLSACSAVALQLTEPGHLVTNPPYGVRLDAPATVLPLYGRLGAHLKQAFPGWEAHILVPEGEHGHALGLRAHRIHALANGPIPCRLLHCRLRTQAEGAASATASGPPEAADLLNRLQKNLARLRPWAAQTQVDCFRVYDADLPEYAVAIDLYGDAAHVQEYSPPKHLDPGRTAARLRTILRLLPAALDIAPSRLFLKQRARQRGSSQYQRVAERNDGHLVHEMGARFWVNLSDYLDTGLFLSHRQVRAYIEARSRGRRFLNLFGYTGTATVRAALGGAVSSLTVDLSQTYLAWAEHNFQLNGLSRQHALCQADCLTWLERAEGSYDLILLDPPTFSNSKRMQGTMVVERDHSALINQAGRLLAPGGTLIFSCNAHGFRLAPESLPDWSLQPLSAETLPRDFARRPQRHHCWALTRP